jgi:ankyrin repeat protein
VLPTGLPLHDAITRHELNTLPDLIKQGADIEVRDQSGRTPLLRALNNNNIQAMETLLTLGANIQATDAEGHSPLHLAVLTCYEWSDDEDMAEFIKDGPFWARWGNKTGPYLLFKNASVRATNHLGRTPFHMVGLRFDRGEQVAPHVEELVTNLVHFKADINARDNNGMTPLHLAVRTGGYPLVHALLANGADVNSKDKKGCTALHYALKADPDSGSQGSRILLDTGNSARPSRVFRSLGFFRPSPNIIRLLLNAKADATVANAEGKTPLSLAEEAGDEVLTQLLQSSVRR